MHYVTPAPPDVGVIYVSAVRRPADAAVGGRATHPQVDDFQASPSRRSNYFGGVVAPEHASAFSDSAPKDAKIAEATKCGFVRKGDLVLQNGVCQGGVCQGATFASR